MKSNLHFYNGITSSDIQETLIKSASELIDEDTPNYQWVAGRLIVYHLRKNVYGSFEPCHIKELVERNVEEGWYDSALLEDYSADEWNELNDYIKHDRDENFTYAAMEQWRGKYLVQNRVTGEIKETPQMAYMLIAATLFADYPRETRLKWV
jgi:ribonucleoside-diphosphate reductase alpha chain